MDYKILSYIDSLTDSYKEPVNLVDGLTFNHKDTLRTIEFYSNNKFLTGNLDELGREKPFHNVGNYRVTTAKTGTDLDVKDIKFEPDSLDDAVQAMLFNHELFKYLKDSNFSETLNDMGKTRPKYGGLLVKKYYDTDDNGRLDIDVVDWKNVDCDPVCILGGPLIETHWMQPSEFSAKSDVWENVDEVLKAHTKHCKNKPQRIEVKEITGEFPFSFDPNEKETEENKMKFKSMCFYVACVGKKKYFLFKEDIEDIEDKYMYLEWEKVPGRGLGKGIIEEGFEAQVWINDAVISIKNAMDLSGKVVLSTDSNKVSGNVLTGVDNGHIFELEQGRSITSLNLAAHSLPEFNNVIALWNTQFDKTSSTYDANTGEAPTAGTPYSQTALLNQVANSPFEYQREVWGIFLNELLNKWILPYLKKRIQKEHYLVSEFSDEDLKIIDEAIKATNVRLALKNQFMDFVNGKEGATIPTPEDQAGMMNDAQGQLSQYGGKREVKIPKGYLDIEGKLTANITGELKNKSAILQSLDNIFKTVVSTFNPNTGQYAALQDPVLSKIFGTIVEMSGVPISSAMLKSMGTSQPTVSPMQPDLSAVAPQAPQLTA